jgi:chitodextrinase
MKNRTITILIVIATSLCRVAYLLPHTAHAQDSSCLSELNQALAQASSSIQQLREEETAAISQAEIAGRNSAEAQQLAHGGIVANNGIMANINSTTQFNISQIEQEYAQEIDAAESQLDKEEANNDILCAAEDESQQQGPSVLFPPVDITANPLSFSEISLSWTQTSNGGNFVYRNGNLIGSTNSNTYLDALDLAPDTTYTYTISTYDPEGTVSTQSDSVTATTLGASATASNVITASGSITQNLQLGDSGAQVIALQTFLKSVNYLSMPRGVTEGYFGSLTKEALAAFQLATGLPNTGYCGSLTRAMIGEVEASESPNAN